MISTATADTSASVNAGAGPATNQTAKVAIAIAITTGTKYADVASASRWIGALDACACCTMRMICASIVSAPTLTARTRSEPVVFIVAPMTVSPPVFGHRHRFPPGHHRLVHRGLPGQDRGIDRDLLAGGG